MRAKAKIKDDSLEISTIHTAFFNISIQKWG